MFFIIVLGILLRLSFIDKPEGLWNDEYVSWFVSNTPFGEGFWSEVLKQCHMPLYYLYLKPFSGFSDLVLRLTSFVPGVISIYIMYLAGKEFSKKVGIVAALLTSTLSFLIYYSQEVRFYSLLFLFSALSMLFTIKFLKNSSKTNLAGYIISNILIIFTHVLGIIYVIFNIIYVVLQKKKFSKSVLWGILVCTLVTGFFGLNIIKMLPASQWWGHFGYTNILFLISDYFSPILTNNVNAPPVFFYNKNLNLFLLIPSIIAIFVMFYGITTQKNYKYTKGLLSVALLFIASLAVLAGMGKLVFITKYTIEALPILILLLAIGFETLKTAGTVLLALFTLFHLGTFFTPYYVTKMPRGEGHRIVGEILNNQNSQNVVFTYYAPDRFYRYANLEGKNLYSVDKLNHPDYVDKPEKILENIKIGETVSVVFLNSVSFFDEDFVKNNINNKNIPEMFLIFSHIKNCLVDELAVNYSDYDVSKYGDWTVIKARKVK